MLNQKNAIKIVEPQFFFMIHPLSIRCYDIRVLFVRHGQIDFVPFTISVIIDGDRMKIWILKIEIENGILASQIRKITTIV